MPGYLVITGPGRCLGFRCAGLECREVSEKEDMGGVLLDLQAEGRWGVVAMEEALFEKVPANVMRRIRKRGLPIIVNVRIPEKWEEKEAGESPVVRLIRRAIGYQIKIKR